MAWAEPLSAPEGYISRGQRGGALVFAIGLFTICTRGHSLFTSGACYIFDNKPGYLISLVVIWLGNLLGCMFLAGLENLTAICGAESSINVTAEVLEK